MRYIYRDQSTRGGGVLLLSSGIVLLLACLSMALFADVAPAQAWVILFLLLLITAAVGYYKLTEPLYLLELNDQGVLYHHRYGNWLLPWDAFSHVRVVELIGQGPLPFVGFKVTDIDKFLTHLPLRLAVKLLVEQRHLFISALRYNCATGQCPSQFMQEMGAFQSKQHLYTGVQAMFAHRMQGCSELFGLELFIPTQGLPMPVDEFCRQVNQRRLLFIQQTS